MFFSVLMWAFLHVGGHGEEIISQMGSCTEDKVGQCAGPEDTDVFSSLQMKKARDDNGGKSDGRGRRGPGRRDGKGGEASKEGDAAKGEALPAQSLSGGGALCTAALVAQGCLELTGSHNQTRVTPRNLADAFNTDLNSSKRFFASMSMGTSQGQGVGCSELCSGVVGRIPADLLPPGAMLGSRRGSDGNLSWDVDLSDAFLDSIIIPEEAPDAPNHEMENKSASLLQAYSEGNYTPDPLTDDDLLYLVANAFDLYPALPSGGAASSEKVTSLAEAGSCSTEHIFGDGSSYAGCQTQTAEGDTCLEWSRFGGSVGAANYCRNTDGSPGIWCYVSEGGSWGYCEPVGAPAGFTKATNDVLVFAQAWMAKSLANFNAYHLPVAYEKWLGPSEVRRTGVTKEGCTCKQSWTYQGTQIDSFCGNPGTPDVGGDWCFVTDDAVGTACQGADWGYCAPSSDLIQTINGCACQKEWSNITDYCGNPDGDTKGAWCMTQGQCQGTNYGYCKSLCGAECQSLRKRLQETQSWLKKLVWKYDAASVGVFAYVMTRSSTKKLVPVLRIGDIQDSYKSTDSKVMMADTSWSSTHGGRKEIVLCPSWWNAISSCKDNLQTCSAYSLGTAIGTFIHETMHHFPMGFDDYLYYRTTVAHFTAKNKHSSEAMKVVKDCADCVEYFLGDNNGYTNTGR